MAALDPVSLLRGMAGAANEAVSPARTIPKELATLKPRAGGRTLLICIGKAAAQMAAVAEDLLLKTHGREKFSGLVVTKHGNAIPLQHLEVMTAGHPEADEASMTAARRILEETGKLTPKDRLLVLMSGGASALTLLPAGDLGFADVTAVNRELLRGVPIDEMNIVRRHISAFNGGRLARAANGAEIITLAVSDVPGDRPEIIGSGPTAPDPSTFADARKVRAAHGLSFPQAVNDYLAASQDESVKPDDPLWRKKYKFKVIASNRHALEAAARYAEEQGVTPIILDEPIAGDAALEAKRFAEIVRSHTYKGKMIEGPAVLIRGGEAVVKLPADFKGKGGRVGHAALSYLIHDPDHYAAFIATDGSDGTSGHSAIYLGPCTMTCAERERLDAPRSLREYGSAAFFDALGAAEAERPTGTNVNEIYLAYLP